MMIEMLLSQLKNAQDEEMRLIKVEIEARNEYEIAALTRQDKTLECLRIKDRIDYMKRHG